eukprot:11123645-Alexandrium_andersonii.AAC.1
MASTFSCDVFEFALRAPSADARRQTHSCSQSKGFASEVCASASDQSEGRVGRQGAVCASS